MRGPGLAAVATLLTCLTMAAACQLPVSIGPQRTSQPPVVVVWWSADRSPVVSFAASELTRYLTRMSGKAVGLHAGSLNGTPPARVAAAIAVLTGPAAAAAQDDVVRLDPAKVAVPARSLGDAAGDAFATRAQGDTASLVAADPRGILYAAYDLLEQLGARFFAPSLAAYRDAAETVPRRAIVLPAYQTAQQAGLRSRALDLDEGWSVSAGRLSALVDWMGKARMNVLAIPADLDASTYDSWRAQLTPVVAQRGIVVEVGQHGFQTWLPPARYPQYYTNGYNVFNVTDEQAVGAYVGAVVAYLTARPEIGIFDAWPPDSAIWPPAVVRRFGSASNAQAYLVGRLTAAVTARLPGVRIETIAYQSTQDPPTAPYAYDPRRNIVDVAMAFRSYAAPISDPVNLSSAALVQRWRRAFTGDLGAYEYYRRYAFRSLPFPLADVIGGDVRWYQQTGVTGIRAYGEPGDWITYELTHLAMAAMAWEPRQDPAALVAGYLHDRFGAAADGMGRYLSAAAAAGRAAFGTGAPISQAMLDAATTGYAAAAAALVDAASFARPSTAAAFLIQRLQWNADFALDDARLTSSMASGDVVTALQARAAGAALLQAHALDGIFVDSPRYAPDYDGGTWSSQDYSREYRTGVAFVQPAGVVTLVPGATVQLRVTAQAPDLGTHRVTWSLSGGGLVFAPGAGTLDVSGGNPASATLAVTAGRGTGRVHVGLTARSGTDTWSVTGLDIVVAGAGDLTPYRDSVAVTSDAALASPTFDGHGCGYSQQALVAAGLASGGQIAVDGLTVQWPTTGGAPDNVVTRGQVVALPPGTKGSRLLLLTAATQGDVRGAGWVTYADASRSYYQVQVPDWRLSGGAASLAAGARVIVQGAYHTCGLPTAGAAYVYAVELPLDPSRDVSSVTLPVAFGGGILHLFALTVG